MALVSLYTVFVGLVLYLIVAMSDLLHGGIRLDASAFERLIESLPADVSAPD